MGKIRNEKGFFEKGPTTDDEVMERRIAKVKRGVTPAQNPTTAIKRADESPEEMNARIIRSIMYEREIARDTDINDVDSLFRALGRYIEHCLESGTRVTNQGAYAACGVSKQAVTDWRTGRGRSSNPRYKEFATTLSSVCAQYREAAMSSGQINPILGIWWQKVYEGFRENEIVNDAKTDLLGDGSDDQDIAKKYADLPD